MRYRFALSEWENQRFESLLAAVSEGVIECAGARGLRATGPWQFLRDEQNRVIGIDVEAEQEGEAVVVAESQDAFALRPVEPKTEDPESEGPESEAG